MLKRMVRTSSGGLVAITLERCQAVQLDARQCCSHDLRDEHDEVLCWTHRQARTVRPLVIVESVRRS